MTLINKIKIILVFSLLTGGLFAQKNGIGFGLGYAKLNNPEWNKVINAFNQTYNCNLAYLEHIPQAELIFERKITEYLYAQAYLNGGFVQAKGSSTVNASIKLLFAEGIANINWYPVKMIKNMKPTPINPLFIRLGGGVNYNRGEVSKEADSTFLDFNGTLTVNNISPVVKAGLGYDLHFGKRLIVQPYFGYKLYLTLEMNEFNEFMLNNTNNGLMDGGQSGAIHASVSFIFLL